MLEECGADARMDIVCVLERQRACEDNAGSAGKGDSVLWMKPSSHKTPTRKEGMYRVGEQTGP